MFDILSAFYAWVVQEEELLEVSPLSFKAPSRGKPRIRALNRQEIVALWTATEVVGAPWKQLYRCSLILGLRREEASGLRWDELDFINRELSLPEDRTKTGIVHVLPLPQMAIDELQEIQQEGAYVFTRNHGKGSVKFHQKAKRAVDAEMKKLLGAEFKPWQFRDLRRTARTGYASMGIPEETAEFILSHRKKGIVGVYNVYQYQERMLAGLEEWCRYLKGLCEGIG
jgi:integrase